MQKHPQQMQPRQFVPPLFVFSLVAFLLMALFFPFGKWALLLVGGSYLIANLAASLIVVARKGGWRFLPLLPLTFAILHVAYGSGFLMGLVKFRNRWRDRELRSSGSAAIARTSVINHHSSECEVTTSSR
jgi:hypothetical protein